MLLIIMLLVLAAVAVWWRFFRGGERAQVRRQFETLADAVAKDGDEGNLVAALKAEKLSRLFAPECDFEFKEEELNGVFNPEQLRALTMRGRTRFRRIALSFPDFSATFPEPDLAVVAVTARFQALRDETRAADEIRELECELRKDAGEWKFHRVAVVQVLRR